MECPWKSARTSVQSAIWKIFLPSIRYRNWQNYFKILDLMFSPVSEKFEILLSNKMAYNCIKKFLSFKYECLWIKKKYFKFIRISLNVNLFFFSKERYAVGDHIIRAAFNNWKISWISKEIFDQFFWSLNCISSFKMQFLKSSALAYTPNLAPFFIANFTEIFGNVLWVWQQGRPISALPKFFNFEAGTLKYFLKRVCRG